LEQIRYTFQFRSPGLHLDVDPIHYFDESKYNAVTKKLNSLSYNHISQFITENSIKNIKMNRQCQGVLNILDNSDENGGFQFIPNGHNISKEWFVENRKRLDTMPSDPNGRYFFEKRDYQFTQPVRLSCPAGTLIIFDVALPHGTQPNRSGNSRIAQFLRYIPKNVFDDQTLNKRRKLIVKYCADNKIELLEKEVI
jgi:ectoine hydroxylase-related dioxygenase (phytanoyl-CoA dioxygenase family)